MLNDSRSWASTAPNDQDVEALVHALRAVDHASAWERVLEVGKLVFDSLMGGNEAEWRSRRGRKNVSLRKLVQHTKCPFRKSALCSAVNIHLLVVREPSVRSMTGITPTHVAQTVSLEPARALELLRKAAHHEWTSRELGEKVRRLRKEQGERRGRPLAAVDRKARNSGFRAARALSDMREQLLICRSLSDESCRELSFALDELAGLVASIRDLPQLSRRSGVIVMAKVAPRAVPEAAVG